MIINILKKIAVFVFILFLLFQLSFCIVFFSQGTEFSTLSFSNAYYCYFMKLFFGQLQLGPTTSRITFAQYIHNELPHTIELCLVALFFSLLIGIFFGVIAGLKLHSWPNKLINAFGLIIASCPLVWLAVLIIYSVSDQNYLLPDTGSLIEQVNPISGFTMVDIFLTPGISKTEELVKEIRYILLPVAILSIYPTIIIIQLVSQRIAYVSHQNYITMVTIREQSQWKILFRHMLPNVLPPIMPRVAYILSILLFYAMLIEIIFNRPGLGSWAMDAYLEKNYTVIAIILILCGIIISTLNLLIDFVTIIIRPLRNRDIHNE